MTTINKLNKDTNTALYIHSLNGRGQDGLRFWINCGPEEQECEAANAEVDETALAVRHKGPEICSHYALPPMSVRLIKILPSQGRQHYYIEEVKNENLKGPA